MQSNLTHKATDMLERLKNFPQHSKLILGCTPLVWLIYVEFAPNHKFFIVVDRSGGCLK